MKSEGSKYYRRESVDHVNGRWSTLEENDGAGGKRQQGIWVSLEDGEETSGSYIENKMTKDILWLWERDGVYVADMMVALPARELKGKPLLERRSM